MPRSKSPTGQKRNHFVKIAFTQSEYEAMQTAAAQTPYPLAVYARLKLQDKKRTPRTAVSFEQWADLGRTIAHLHQIKRLLISAVEQGVEVPALLFGLLEEELLTLSQLRSANRTGGKL